VSQGTPEREVQIEGFEEAILAAESRGRRPDGDVRRGGGGDRVGGRGIEPDEERFWLCSCSVGGDIELRSSADPIQDCTCTDFDGAYPVAGL